MRCIIRRFLNIAFISFGFGLAVVAISWALSVIGGGGVGWSSHAIYRSMSIVVESPDDADTFIIGVSDQTLTITGVDCICEDATSAVMTAQECDTNGNTCGTIESLTCLTTMTTDDGVDDAEVAVGNVMRVDIGTVTDTPGHCTMTIHATH